MCFLVWGSGRRTCLRREESGACRPRQGQHTGNAIEVHGLRLKKATPLLNLGQLVRGDIVAARLQCELFASELNRLGAW